VAAGVDPLIKLMVTTSHAARPHFAATSVDLLFIDGSHEYEDVVTDITDWETVLKDDSVVALMIRQLREFIEHFVNSC
jgi:hypothetical protein